MMSQSTASARCAYDSDLTDEQWNLVKGVVPGVQSNTSTGGRPPKYDRREILNAILYVTRTGCQWRLLPHDFPNWRTVYTYFTGWHEAGVFEDINTQLREHVRTKTKRKTQPSAGIIDSQSVKIGAFLGFSGFDGAKKVNGRKRHIVTDTLGLLLAVKVHEGNLQDRGTAKEIVVSLKATCTRITKVFADQGYTGSVVGEIKAACNVTLAVIKRTEARAFRVLPRRWVVERTFGWFGFYRRLSKDYERYPTHSEAFVYLAMSTVMLNRLEPGRGF